MRICIDIRCLAGGRRSGVEEYVLGLLEALFRIDKRNEYVLFLNSFSDHGADLSLFENLSNVSIKRLRWPNKLLNFLMWYFSWPKIDRLAGGADIVFMPNINFGSASRGSKLVVTMHDLSFERHPRHFSLKRRLWHLFVDPRRLCRKADRLIAVSDSTKQDVENLYGIRPERVICIPSAVSDSFRVIDRNDRELISVKEKYGLPFRFILYLGTVEPRKNIVGLIRAFNQFQEEAARNGDEELRKYSLVLAGSKGWLEKGISDELFRSPFRSKIILAGFIDDKDKPFVYNLASLFAYPSFFEGFGFPPLEAMRCGVPVIASNGSSMPEICGDAAILIDPDKTGELAIAIREILKDRRLHDLLSYKGIAKSDAFSWDKAARETLKLLIRTARA